jgi:DNA-binding IclR family transcriptional regulator
MPSRPNAASQAAPPDPEEAGGSALSKGFTVLEAVLASDEPVQLADLAQRLHLPKTSVHRLLLQLEEARLVRRDLSGKAWLQAPRLVGLSLRALTRAARAEPAHAALRRLVDEIGESVNLATLDRGEIVYLDRVECDWPLRTTFQPGSRVPVHCTASGKLLLAAMEPADRAALLGEGRKLPAYTGRTLTSHEALGAELARIRENWVAVNDQEYMVGLIGVAVPVRGRDGQVVASLALHAPVPRLTVEEALRHVPRLRKAAEEVAQGLLT